MGYAGLWQRRRCHSDPQSVAQEDSVGALEEENGKALDFVRRLVAMQHDLSWASLAERNVPDREICGTEEWTREVIGLSAASRHDRRLLRQLVDGHKTPAGLSLDMRRVLVGVCEFPFEFIRERKNGLGFDRGREGRAPSRPCGPLHPRPSSGR